MKKLLMLLWIAPTMALAASPFDGTWKTKADSFQISGTPDAYEISQGMYRCTSCVPPINVKADGTDQSVTGHDYYDTVAVRIVNNNSVEWTHKKGGKIVSTDALTVSGDGKTLTENGSPTREQNPQRDFYLQATNCGTVGFACTVRNVATGTLQ